MERISLNIKKVARRTDVVSKSTNGGSSSGDIVVRPLANETDKVVALVFSVEDLRKEVEVAHEGRLKNDGDVRSIEQFDGIRHFVTTDLSVAESQFDAEALKLITRVSTFETIKNRKNQTSKEVAGGTKLSLAMDLRMNDVVIMIICMVILDLIILTYLEVDNDKEHDHGRQ